MNKILSIGLIIIISFVLFSGQTLAASNKSHNNNGKGYEKPTKSEITYDVPDSGDNKHPSGKDRSVENGRSLTQGKAKSNPDSNGKGPDRLDTGVDKPGKGGGVDKYDQDGNNGCGNDDDFEDDNEGWCGNKPKKDNDCKVNCNPCKYNCEPPTCENGKKSEKECKPTCENDGKTGKECDKPERDCDPKCEEDCDEEPECTNCGGTNEDPKDPQEPKTPEVKGTSLPVTGFDSNGYLDLLGDLALAFSMVIAGVLVHLVSKYRHVFIK